jgi:iron-sulfur cluster assembly protein
MAMSTTETTETATTITLSERAASEIKGLFERENMTTAALRVFVSGGGCSGLQYGMQIAEETEPDDIETEQHGVRVLVDPLSLRYLAGASVDFVDDEMGGGFKIDNPNALQSCGCGSSFAAEGESSCGSCGGGCGG